jgi:hypothetical protein
MANSLVISSWTEATVAASGTAAAVAPVANQKVLRLYPLAGGTVYYGFTSSVTTSTGEKFSQASPITIMTGQTVYIITSGTAINVRAMKGA